MNKREKIWDSFKYKKFDKYLKDTKRMFTKYNRYYEAKFINKEIDGKRVVKIVDYGCGSGDYGIYLLRRAKDREIRFYDYQSVLDFVKFRIGRAGLEAKYIRVSGIANNFIFNEADLVIFGEVLEHLKNPLEVLKKCKEKKVRYIFTSSYPYRHGEDYWKQRDHLKNAKLQMKGCRVFLEENYTFKKFTGELRLWENI